MAILGAHNLEVGRASDLLQDKAAHLSLGRGVNCQLVGFTYHYIIGCHIRVRDWGHSGIGLLQTLMQYEKSKGSDRRHLVRLQLFAFHVRPYHFLGNCKQTPCLTVQLNIHYYFVESNNKQDVA